MYIKPGDKVICIDSKNVKNLKRCHTYTVSEVFFMDERISLVEFPTARYYDHRFIVKPINEFRVGDKIVLIDNSGGVILKKNNIYTVSNYHMQLDRYDELVTKVSLYECSGQFDCERFVSLKKYRKDKMQIICSK